MGKTTQSTQSSSSPPPQVLANYQNLVNQAQGIAAQPYTPYTGQIYAPGTYDQNVGMQNLDYLYDFATPYLNQASTYTNNSATPITLDPSQYSSLISPYSQSGAQQATQAGLGLAQYGTQQGAGISQYGTQAAQGIAGLANNVASQGPQLQQFSADAINQYMNPYTQQVIDATMANINKTNAGQQNDLVSRGIMSGNAFGGDRLGVTSAELARNQDLASNQVIAGLLSNGYNQAVSQFDTNNQQALAGQQTALQGLGAAGQLGVGAQQAGAQLGLTGQQAGGQLGLAGAQLGAQGYQSAQQLSLAQQQALAQQQLAAGAQTAGLGNQALNNQLTAAQAQIASGQMQQQNAQNELNVPYQQFLQQQAYPYQNLNWLANIVLGTGGASGQNTTTTSPGQSLLSQGLGAAATGVGALGATGAFGAAGWLTPMLAALKDGGSVIPKGLAGGGAVGMPANSSGLYQPIDFSSAPMVQSYVPNPAQLPSARLNSPSVSIPNNQGGLGPSSGLLGQAAAMTRQNNGLTGGWGATSAMGDPTGLGGLYADGGLVTSFGKFADGGFPDDPFGDDNRQIGYDLLRKGLGTFAPDSIPGGEPPPVANPGDPIRLGLPGPEGNPANMPGGIPANANPALMADVDQPTGLGASTEVAGAPLPQSRPQGLGDSTPLPSIIANGPDGMPADSGLGAGLAFADNGSRAIPQQILPPSAAPQGLGAAAQGQPPVPQSAQPNPWLAVLAAGLGMMSSRSPNALGGIGEGGLAGLSNYMAQQKSINEMDAHPVIDNSGPTQRIYYPSTKQWVDTGIPTMSAVQQAQLKETTRAHDLQAQQLAETASYHKGLLEQGYQPKVVNVTNEDGATVPVVFDPNTKKFTDLNGKPYTPAQSAAKTDADGKPLTGDAYLATLSPQRAAMAKGIGDYTINPQSLSIRGGHREQALTDAARFNPNFDATQYSARAKAVRDFATGPQGNTIRSLDVAIDHLDTLQAAANAMKNGDLKAVNTLRNMWREQTGSELPGNFDAIKTIVGSEIAKAVVGGQNALHDRLAAQEQAQNAKSPEQIAGVIRSYKQLMAGQLHGLQQQYESTTGLKNFNTRLRPNTIKELETAQQAQNANRSSGESKLTVRSKSEYDALPTGSEFIGSDGKTYRKP